MLKNRKKNQEKQEKIKNEMKHNVKRGKNAKNFKLFTKSSRKL